ncbi:MAG: hypothetical protein ACE5FS_13225 [Paracoccaceae bacterium]
MPGLDEHEFDQDGTVFRDVITLALLGFVTIVVILLPHLNPPVQANDIASPGNLYVQAVWAPGLDTDVDLWVRAPDDRPVGYSAKDGRIFNLLRDDLGRKGPEDTSNFEVAFSRGAPAGEYVVNLHLYSDRERVYPLPVDVEVSLRGAGGKLTTVSKTRVTLTHIGQEITVIRFRLDRRGRLVTGSRHNLQIALRGGGTNGQSGG